MNGAKPDSERRKRQAHKYARVMAVNRLIDKSQTIHLNAVSEIAKLLNVSERTIYRDIAVIREADRILSEAGL